MTRKDYIAIAAAIRATQERIRKTRFSSPGSPNGKAYPIDQAEQLRGVRRAAAHIADALKADNPAGFDPVLFLKNCGYGVGPVFKGDTYAASEARDGPVERHARGEILDN